MCFSTTVSYGTAAVLLSAGTSAIHQTRRLPNRYWLLWAAIPVLFGVQQAFEGMVWQQLDAGHAQGAVPYALGFHFFSHFLWLWWLSLSSYLVEPARARRWVIGGGTMLGVFCGTRVYGAMLTEPDGCPSPSATTPSPTASPPPTAAPSTCRSRRLACTP